MSDPVEKLLGIVASKLRRNPYISLDKLVAEVRKSMASNPELGNALRDAPELLQINNERASAFQTLVKAGGTAFIGTTYVGITSEELAHVVKEILHEFCSPETQLSDFENYLKSVVASYRDWHRLYTPTDAVTSRVHDFRLMAQNAAPKDRTGEPFPVLNGIRTGLSHDVQLLLVGKPGSGKSTTLVRFLLETATEVLEIQDGKIPVLVELRYWKTTPVERILAFLHRHDPRLTIDDATVSNFLRAGKFLLILDGINELPSDEARSSLSAFRRDHPNVPMLFSSRDLGLAEDLGISRRIEMLPLNMEQKQGFIRAYIPESSDEVWRKVANLGLQDFCSVPLLLWMLCETVRHQPDQKMPSDLAEIFRKFVQFYEAGSMRLHELANLKGDVRPLSDRRLWKDAMTAVALRMMQGKKPANLSLTIERVEAERLITESFERERTPSRDILDDLLNYHLLQPFSLSHLEFRHQLIQEYYAAEGLLPELDTLSDEQLKRKYLNYFKWTEPFKMVVTLLDSGLLLNRVVKLAGEIDPTLKRRLTDAAGPKFERYKMPKAESSAADDAGLPYPAGVAGSPYPAPQTIPLWLAEVWNLDGALQKRIRQAQALIAEADSTQLSPESTRDLNDIAVSLESDEDTSEIERRIELVDKCLIKVSGVNKSDPEGLSALRASIEELEKHKGKSVTKRLLGLVDSKHYLAKRCAALILCGYQQRYKPGNHYDRTPQEIFLEPSKKSDCSYTRPFAEVGWIALLVDPNADLRADAITLWSRFPNSLAIPVLISKLHDEGMYHDWGEDRGKDHVFDRALEVLLKIIETEDISEFSMYLAGLKTMQTNSSRRRPFFGSSSFDKVGRIISAIQSRCLYYDHEMHERTSAPTVPGDGECGGIEHKR